MKFRSKLEVCGLVGGIGTSAAVLTLAVSDKPEIFLGRNRMEFVTATVNVTAMALTIFASVVSAKCDSVEIMIKLSHFTNTDKHPKGIAASLLQSRVNEEIHGIACMDVFPNSMLFNDNRVLEAIFRAI